MQRNYFHHIDLNSLGFKDSTGFQQTSLEQIAEWERMLNTLRKESSTLVCPLKLYLARACPSDCRAASWACSMEVIT